MQPQSLLMPTAPTHDTLQNFYISILDFWAKWLLKQKEALMPIKKLSLYHLKSDNSYRKQTVFGMDRMVIRAWK